MDDFVKPDSIARLIDAFAESLDLTQYDITKSKPSDEGRPAYDPKELLKLYIYGYRAGTRSSRKLAAECITNIEVRWMMSGLEPDFRTVANFRRDNIKEMKKIFHEFNGRLAGAVQWGFTSVDGSKFRAWNAKDDNFTANKLDERIERLNSHTDEYIRMLEEMDKIEDEDELLESGILTRDEIERQLKEARERLEKYEGYRQILEEEGISQLSITDIDSKLMKSKNGFMVAYNPQTAVDSETHLIRDFEMTNQVTDHGLLEATMENIKKSSGDEIIHCVADKGYNSEEDIANCLEEGIIPSVIMDDGKEFYEIEREYEEAECDPKSRKSEELKKCLRSGVIPEAYEGVVRGIEVVGRKKFIPDEKENRAESPYGTEEEMLERAEEGYFVRDPERNIVYCPAGETLRQKCVKKNGNIRYANKKACRHCPHRNRCYKGKSEWKEIDFNKDTLEKPCRGWSKETEKKPGAGKGKTGHYEKIRTVVYRFYPDRQKMKKRMCLSEHPFGTIKRAMGAGYFLLRGKIKVTGEFALMCLGYNIQRAKNLLGFEKMMELMSIEM